MSGNAPQPEKTKISGIKQKGQLSLEMHFNLQNQDFWNFNFKAESLKMHVRLQK